MPSYLSDFIFVLFSPKRFFTHRFLALSSQRITYLGFFGMLIGLLFGSLATAGFSHVVGNDLVANPPAYQVALQSLNITEQAFLELIKAQKAYCLLIAFLSPLIAYMTPHILGGTLFVFTKLLVRQENTQITFHKVMECVSISLVSMTFYAIPMIGALIALILVGVNLSRALFVYYKITGFMKAMSVVSALYVCFVLSSATLQLLSVPMVNFLP